MTAGNSEFWFVSYEIRILDSDRVSLSNVVLAGRHPLVWLSNPPEVFEKNCIHNLLFFAPIDEATFNATDKANYVSVEDYRDKTVRRVASNWAIGEARRLLTNTGVPDNGCTVASLAGMLDTAQGLDSVRTQELIDKMMTGKPERAEPFGRYAGHIMDEFAGLLEELSGDDD